MEEIEIKKIVEIDKNNLNKITEWMYEWWGKDERALQRGGFVWRNQV